MSACLLDTNILLYLADPASWDHAVTKAAVTRLLAAGDRLVVSAQVLFEFLERGDATHRSKWFGVVRRAGSGRGGNHP